MAPSQTFSSHAETPACFMLPGSPASGPLGSEEEVSLPGTDVLEPCRTRSPLQLAPGCVLCQRVGVWPQQPPSLVLAGAVPCRPAVVSPLPHLSPSPGFQALLLATCPSCKVVGMDPEPGGT